MHYKILKFTPTHNNVMQQRVKRCIEAGLVDINEDCSSDEEQQAPEDFTQILESRTGWKDFEEVNATLHAIITGQYT